MLLHIVPKILMPSRNSEVDLVDIRIPELGVSLDLSQVKTCKPYPNPKFLVACARAERRSVDGLLFQVDAMLPVFSVLTRWRARVPHHPRWINVLHEAHHTLLDAELDCVSQSPMHWMETSNKPSRCPQDFTFSHVEAAPVMGLQPSLLKSRLDTLTDVYENGILVHRKETLALPTVYRDVVLSDLIFPAPSHRFNV